jgi:flagellar assembly protein FliH
MTITHKKFGFDTVFDDEGGVASQAARVKRAFTPEEVIVERTLAFAEGERSVTARAEQAAAAALGGIAESVRAAMSALAKVAHEHRATSAELSLACGRTIAGAALEKYPDAPVVAALLALAREVEAEPHLTVRAKPDLVDRMQATLDRTAESCGFPGRITVRSDPSLPAAAFTLDWRDGRAVFDPVESASRVQAALDNALAAEGLHAEPLVPANPASGDL